MKFVFFGYDQSLDIAAHLVDEGHELTQLFTFPCDNMFAFNTHTLAYSQHHNIPCTQEKITKAQINDLVQKGVTLFLSCGYPYKIPPIDETVAYGVNLHPALLPKARGIMPTPYIIMEEPNAAGMTLHKLAPRIDAGDILAQYPVPIDETTDIDVLTARLGLHAPDFVLQSLNDLENLWKNAQPQDESKASTYPAPDETMRHMDWTQDVQTLNKKARAFGRYGTTAIITNTMGQSQKLAVYQSTAWKEAHNHAPGQLMRSSPREVVLAVQDGYICLKEFQIIE